MKTTLKRGATRGATNGVPSLPPSPLTTITRYGPPPRSRLRLVGKIFGWLAAIVLMTAGGLAGGLWLYYAEYSIAGTAPSTPEEKEAQAILDRVPPPDKPAVAIVIGYDRRFGEEGRGVESRSDTIMLIRADPELEMISMLSFPRDLLVELAGCRDHAPRVGRINQAFTDCGARGTIETVRNLTNVPINYYVTVNFRGFIRVIDDLGGVYVDVDRRYLNQSEASYAAIDLRPGYQRLPGGKALAFVRYRHTDNDFYRNARQQEFVKAVKQQISGLSAAFKLRGIVDVLRGNVTIGAGGTQELTIETIYAYSRLAYELPSGNLVQARIQGLTDNGYYDVVAPEEEIEKAVDAFMNPDPEAAEKAAVAATGGKPRSRVRRGPPPREVTVEVLNGNGVAGAADDAAYLLSQRSYQALDGGNAPHFEYFQTEVVYDPSVDGAEEAAAEMAKLFGDANVVEAPAGEELDTMLRVTVGKTFGGTLAPLPRDTTPKHEPPKVVTDPASVAPLVRQAERKIDFPVLVPTVREESSSLSTLEPMRVYRVRPGEQAVRFVYNGPFATDYWGVQQTSWTDAPILADPTVVRRIGSREYRLYFSGSHIHMVAFEENGAVYWVSNTLLDALSNETMLAIAKGLKPLRK